MLQRTLESFCGKYIKLVIQKCSAAHQNSVDLICRRLARSSRYVEEQRNLQLSCEPTWLMVATFVAICCLDEICSRGRWYSYSVRLKIIVATEHYTPSTFFIDTTHAQHAEDQKQPARAAALTYEIKPEDVTRTFLEWLWSSIQLKLGPCYSGSCSLLMPSAW